MSLSPDQPPGHCQPEIFLSDFGRKHLKVKQNRIGSNDIRAMSLFHQTRLRGFAHLLYGDPTGPLMGRMERSYIQSEVRDEMERMTRLNIAGALLALHDKSSLDQKTSRLN